MKRYPKYRFFLSQPQLYEYVKEDAPEIFEQVKERVKEGRWEADGAMWLESDCNLTSGESLIVRFYMERNFSMKSLALKSRRYCGCLSIWLFRCIAADHEEKRYSLLPDNKDGLE